MVSFCPSKNSGHGYNGVLPPWYLTRESKDAKDGRGGAADMECHYLGGRSRSRGLGSFRSFAWEDSQHGLFRRSFSRIDSPAFSVNGLQLRQAMGY